jgi:hypothetical protein
MLVLEGPQGAGKSTAIGVLGGQWYVAKLPPVRDYAKAAHAMGFHHGQGKWLGAPMLEIPATAVPVGRRKGMTESWG